MQIRRDPEAPWQSASEVIKQGHILIRYNKSKLQPAISYRPTPRIVFRHKSRAIEVLDTVNGSSIKMYHILWLYIAEQVGYYSYSLPGTLDSSIYSYLMYQIYPWGHHKSTQAFCPPGGIYCLIMQDLIRTRLKLSEKEIREGRQTLMKTWKEMSSWEFIPVYHFWKSNSKSLWAKKTESNALGMKRFFFQSTLLCTCCDETSNINSLNWLDGSQYSIPQRTDNFCVGKERW